MEYLCLKSIVLQYNAKESNDRVMQLLSTLSNSFPMGFSIHTHEQDFLKSQNKAQIV